MSVFFSRLKQAFILLTGMTLTTAVSAALPSFNPATSSLLFTMHGSNTIGAKLAPNLINDYLNAKGGSNIKIIPLERENEIRVQATLDGRSVHVDIAAHGSSTGFRALERSQADIAMASRPIKSKEQQALSHFGDMRSNRAEHVIAIDGLAIIVHRKNPVHKLTLQQIAAIFAGKITNWSQLGGQNGRIKVLARDNQSGTWDTFKSLILGKNYSLTPSAARFESNDQLSDRVSADANSIGFVGLASIRQAKAIAVSDGNTQPQAPEHLTIATEDYPLSRRLFLYTAAYAVKPAAQEFLQFVQSEQGQEQVKTTGFVAQTPIGVKAEANRDGPSEYLELTKNAERLSINVRFSEGSASLDNKAQQDIQRLVHFMQKPENRDRRLLLIGFGDKKVSRERSVVLSKLRAATVRSALRDHQINTAPVQGFGAYLPVASNTSSSKIKNRRVEIWVI
ncbi:phosphate ABC transporter substrate-binding/OmpA family protein [Microbulbifer sp. OS29]|uniref:Phosphate ABC transporter substrate-binding/OmpA family protein n=1 Tax=Microbulbifer okhotskensis TaxID=2926617 RepID=A0A9X2J6B2_9GAMM|nr:phosphate ABC transporter substrate-binding/OmpA family protein [Microbulbifer okhotskensis]MCO1334440.1 phosphate ABC transporter substrate-binding/OmpA family protein [Microbulbifer okhotskensis]